MITLNEVPTSRDCASIAERRPSAEARAVDAAAPTALLTSMLDQVDYPIFLVRGDGRLLHTNRSGRQAALSAVLLRVDTGFLGASHPGDHVDLKAALSVAARLGTRRLLELGRSGRAVMVAVVPLSQPGEPAAAGSAHDRPVVVVAGRSGVSEVGAARWFAARHGLTGAEVRVLEAMLEGVPPKDIAVRHGVAVSTVRTQLASIRAKTGTASLRALVRKVGLLPPMPPILGML